MAIQNIFEETERLKANIENLSVAELKKEMADNNNLLLFLARSLARFIALAE